MKALFGFFIVAFSVLAFQKMSNQEFVEAQGGDPNRNEFEAFCPSDGHTCIGLRTVVITPKK
ncbi:MAG: hypothetical protein CVT98_00545 [Bacteroidetes bacterium HGW-Bacteroidetes-15]|nr:MAG: hypothetical protein CVT98_00545 [Bacteroidetes bacterium HGW-Bacteroidetes-15]